MACSPHSGSFAWDFWVTVDVDVDVESLYSPAIDSTPVAFTERLT